jgi:hypothetical protein
MATSFQIPSSSSFMCHPTIWCDRAMVLTVLWNRPQKKSWVDWEEGVHVRCVKICLLHTNHPPKIHLNIVVLLVPLVFAIKIFRSCHVPRKRQNPEERQALRALLTWWDCTAASGWSSVDVRSHERDCRSWGRWGAVTLERSLTGE